MIPFKDLLFQERHGNYSDKLENRTRVLLLASRSVMHLAIPPAFLFNLSTKLFCDVTGVTPDSEVGAARDQQLRLPDATEHHCREDVQRPQPVPRGEWDISRLLLQ